MSGVVAGEWRVIGPVRTLLAGADVDCPDIPDADLAREPKRTGHIGRWDHLTSSGDQPSDLQR